MVDCHHKRDGAALKRPTQAILSCQNLIVHDGNFEFTVGILPVRIKSQDLTPVKTKYLYFTPPINRSGFHVLKRKKWEPKDGKKINPHPRLFSPVNLFFLSSFSPTTTTSAPSWLSAPPLTNVSLHHHAQLATPPNSGNFLLLSSFFFLLSSFFFLLLPLYFCSCCMQNSFYMQQQS